MKLWTLRPNKTPTGNTITVARGAPETRDRANFASRRPPVTERVVCWDGGRWIEYDAVPEAFHRVAQQHYLDRLAAYRWDRMQDGITHNGIKFRTDLASQSLISGAVLSILVAQQAGQPVPPVNFKAQSGWVELTAEQMIAAGQAVSVYVQQCYAREQALAAEIEAAENLEQLEAIDTSAGWPDTGEEVV